MFGLGCSTLTMPGAWQKNSGRYLTCLLWSYLSPSVRLCLLLKRRYWARKTFGPTKCCSSVFSSHVTEVTTSIYAMQRKKNFQLFLAMCEQRLQKIMDPKSLKKLFVSYIWSMYIKCGCFPQTIQVDKAGSVWVFHVNCGEAFAFHNWRECMGPNLGWEPHSECPSEGQIRLPCAMRHWDLFARRRAKGAWLAPWLVGEVMQS